MKLSELQQVKQDLANGIIISRSQWVKVLDAAIEAISQDQNSIDAQRYRWLRNKANYARDKDPMCFIGIFDKTPIDGDELDEAIDIAITED